MGHIIILLIFQWLPQQLRPNQNGFFLCNFFLRTADDHVSKLNGELSASKSDMFVPQVSPW